MKAYKVCQYPGCMKHLAPPKRKWCASHQESGPLLNSRERAADNWGPMTKVEERRLSCVLPDRVTQRLSDQWLNLAGRMPDSASGEVEGEALL